MGKLHTQGRTRPRRRLILAISGLPGTGKTTLAHAMADRLGGTFFSFGDHVRELVKAQGLSSDRVTLQAVGDDRVTKDAAAFVQGALASLAPEWSSLIVDGVRHVAVLRELRAFADDHDAAFGLIHLDTATPLRRRRLAARGESASVARVTERHASEHDVFNILPCSADVRLDGSGSVADAIEMILAMLGDSAMFEVQSVAGRPS